MAYTKSIIQKSPGRAIVKVVASAQTDSTTIFLKSAVSLGATGNLAFALGDGTSSNGGTITRTSGSWITDFTNAAFATNGASASTGSTLLPGQSVYVAGAGANALNQKHYSIIAITALTITVSALTPVKVAESGLTVTSTAYYSDVLSAGQTIPGTPLVNITNAWASTVTGGGAVFTRNSVVALGLYGGGGDYGEHPPCGPIAENNGSDVVVTWQTGSTTGGVAVVELAKIDGFGDTQPNA